MALRDSIAGAPNAAQPLPWMITCGQPSIEQFQAAALQGVTTVIDLRDPMEPRPLDEAATLATLGVRYVNIPVEVGALDDQTLESILIAIREQGEAPMMIHCASANRVGGALIPYLIIDRGMAEEAAVDVATQVGLRSAALMEWGLSYARARRPQ